MADLFTKLAYQALQQAKETFGYTHKTLGARLLRTISPSTLQQKTEPLSDALVATIQKRREELLEVDWQDAEQGVYPTDLLFDNPWLDVLRYYPDFLIDLPKGWERSKTKHKQDFAPEINTEHYPRYYLQNFHNQTDGYLSDQSANLYDLQVELLFSGAADPMRRRILAPIKAALKPRTKPHRILDVACGTGRTLRMLRGMLPDATLLGVDLSPAYLRKANQLLAELPGELPQLIQANAEQLPYVDNYFDAIASVFLFHELPHQARQNVIAQCFRVLQPGGMLVICDSIQEQDIPEFAVNMKNFPLTFHEPYYRHYITDDLVARLEQVGFTEIQTEIHFMSKYWIAHKPA